MEFIISEQVMFVILFLKYLALMYKGQPYCPLYIDSDIKSGIIRGAAEKGDILINSSLLKNNHRSVT